MTNSKSTKRALVSSTLAVLVCIAMLIGTTFAWFTDVASTAVNRIQSGTLNVALEMLVDGKWVPAENQKLDFVKAPGAEDEEILWEPGCTYALPKLRVANEGNLALKYKVVISGISGDAELNDVIDWTMTLDDERYILGSEHHLAAKKGQEVDADILTIEGTMQESAKNYYQDKSIENIAITVYATQDTVENDSNGNTYDQNADGTPQFDTWYDNVAATEDVVAGAQTVIKDKEVDPTVVATVPAGSTTASKLTLMKSKADTPANITVITGTEAVTADVKLVDQDGNKVTASGSKFFTLTMQLGANLNVVGFYHNDTPLTKAASAEAVTANDMYYYDAASGVVTFTTDDFSPFTAIVSNTVFNGGDGKTANTPYLIATGEQALAMENAKGYFKLVEDVVIPDEIYLFSKTVTLDLNGHSLRLVYGEGVRMINYSPLHVGGKKSSLTINDSSEAQTGAVYGSDQIPADKVSCAVRAGNYGKLTINGGHFYGMSEGGSCVFVYTSRPSSSKATVVINGGKFETASPFNGIYYVLNHQDSNSTSCTITVNGGSFKNYNPGVTKVDPVNAYTGKILLGSGCTTTSTTVGDDTWYTVSK